MAERSWDNFKKDAQKFDNKTSVKKPTKLWYLVAIFLGIIGGLIAYFVLRNRDRKMAMNLLIISIIATVIGGLFDYFVTIPYFFG